MDGMKIKYRWLQNILLPKVVGFSHVEGRYTIHYSIYPSQDISKLRYTLSLFLYRLLN